VIGYQIDFSDVKMFLNRMVWEGDAAIALFFLQAKTVLQEILLETIREVGPTAGPGFPEIYIDHLLEVVAANPPIRDISGGVEVDLTMLGTYADLAKGFHRYAIDVNNERIELPYAGQDLRNEQKVREAFWEDTVAPTFLYDTTLYDRIETWGMLAPEWWVLVNGSSGMPVSNPTPLPEIVSLRAQVELKALYEASMQLAVIKADQGLGIKPSGQAFYNVRDPKAHFPQRWAKR